MTIGRWNQRLRQWCAAFVLHRCVNEPMNQIFRALLLVLGLAVVVWLSTWFGVADLFAAFSRVDSGYLVLYASGALVVLLGYSLRWLVITRAADMRVPLRRLVAARLAGDAVSALLPGGKIGGDPLRVALLYADGRNGVRASAAVALDRVMELIGNSLAGITYVCIFSVTRADGLRAPLLVVLTLLVPLLTLLVAVGMLRAGVHPFTRVFSVVARLLPRLRGGWDALGRTEDQLIQLLRDHPRTFVFGLLGSLLIETLIIAEYHWLLAAFGLTLDLPTLLIVLLMSGLSRVVPTPGGLGALEAGQVTALGFASGQPHVGFVVGMVLRLHETLWMLIGLSVLSMQGVSFVRLRVLAARKVAV